MGHEHWESFEWIDWSREKTRSTHGENWSIGQSLRQGAHAFATMRLVWCHCASNLQLIPECSQVDVLHRKLLVHVASSHRYVFSSCVELRVDRRAYWLHIGVQQGKQLMCHCSKSLSKSVSMLAIVDGSATFSAPDWLCTVRYSQPSLLESFLARHNATFLLCFLVLSFWGFQSMFRWIWW